MTTSAPPYRRGLHDLGDGCHPWLLPDGSWGWSNSGMIVGSGASRMVDTLFDLALTREMLEGCLFEHFALDPDHFRGWLRPGDEVVLAVEQLGELRHRITEPEPIHLLRTGC